VIVSERRDVRENANTITIEAELPGVDEKDVSSPAALILVASYEGRSLGFLDLSGLLAATFSVVFKHEADLVALVERVDAAASSAVAWTNTSLSPPSGWMNPKPLDVLKNLTVPVVRVWVSFPD